MHSYLCCSAGVLPSFYSSQGRATSFEDHNNFLLEYLVSAVPGLTTLEVCFLGFSAYNQIKRARL